MSDKRASQVKLGDLEWIDPAKIRRSSANPRSVEFYKDKDFLRLKESIARFGVIVPIIVRRLTKPVGEHSFELVDGERRWKAASGTNRDVPAYVLPADEPRETLVTMFQIHMNQEEWDAVEQAKALEDMVAQWRVKFHKAGVSEEKLETELAKELTRVTGMDSENARSRLRFLRWPKEIREKVYRDDSQKRYSYIVEIEANIIEPACRNFPGIEDVLPAIEMRRLLFRKVEEGYVARAEAVRDGALLVKTRRDRAEAAKARALFVQVVKQVPYTLSEAHEQYLYLFPDEAEKLSYQPRKLINLVLGLRRALEEYASGIPSGKVRLKKPQVHDLREALKSLLAIAKDVVRLLK